LSCSSTTAPAATWPARPPRTARWPTWCRSRTRPPFRSSPGLDPRPRRRPRGGRMAGWVALDYRGHLRPGETVLMDGYLRRIMVNTHRSWWRARWRRETPTGELPEIVIADFADGQALAAQVRQALQALPERQRAVLVLRYYVDLPEGEVADLLGCSLGTVKT